MRLVTFELDASAQSAKIASMPVVVDVVIALRVESEGFQIDLRLPRLFAPILRTHHERRLMV